MFADESSVRAAYLLSLIYIVSSLFIPLWTLTVRDMVDSAG